MILGFKEQFNKSIKNGTKIHSIRAGDRWKPGMTIHFYNHVRTKRMKKFGELTCESVQDIEIEWQYGDSIYVYVDNVVLLEEEVEKLALNDGFDTVEHFMAWFNKDFQGQIIHWTKYKY